ncbi:hypothetical protein PS712_04140 [Pseudomonas fluorescens]|uniref:Phage tail protein n=1 Tax=Pseudomonas fluorescens TaxID=294 RepID=A0A5E7DQN9_PSEFL|nr:hypothetical protein [Pseudomonas fluorescens]VVO19823.1 hypothetical protein PS712_04140 [Pseudomonas fluorescens]
MHRIDGAGATVDNKFTEGDPVGGVQATVVTAPWLNDMQEELMSVLNAAGIAPVKGTQDQLLKSIRSLSVGIIGASRNVRMVVSTANSSATLTADQVFVGTSLSGQVYRLSSLSKAINLATNGVGGIDTGSAPVNGFVGIYLCYNPSLPPSATNPMLMAQNATAARLPEVYGGVNMPAGYTASALVGVWRTNASGQFIVGSMEGRDVSFAPVQALNTSVGAGTPTILVLSTSAPKNAVKVGGSFNITSAAGSSNACTVQADVNGTGQRFTSQGPGTAISAEIDLSLITDQTLYYTCTVTAAPMGAILTITSFRF